MLITRRGNLCLLIASCSSISCASGRKFHLAFVAKSWRGETSQNGKVAQSPKQIMMVLNSDDNNDEENWDDFNPFKRKTENPVNSLLEASTISLRRMRMKELMNTLLENSLKDDEAIKSILLENEELLLEPLLEDDAVMDEDSIYDLGMNRDQRFERYSQVMLEREETAVNATVKRVLSQMRQFVSSRQ